jgi:hypothetical protein
MPLLTETTHARKRRAPVWLLILVVMALLLLLLVFGWSWHRPVYLKVGVRQGIALGCFSDAHVRGLLPSSPRHRWKAYKLPGGPQAGYYVVGYVWL